MNKSMGLAGMAMKGRGGDTRVAHVSTGETVIPREIGKMRPELVAHVQQAIKQYGGDPRKYTVGAGRINPQTGAEEFATEEEIKAAYQTQLGRDPDAEGMQYWLANPEGFANGFSQAAAAEKASTGLTSTAAPTPSNVSAPTPTTAPKAPTVPATSTPAQGSTSTSDVYDWYRNSVGRDPDAAGLAYWQDRVANGGADAAYGEFQTLIKQNEGPYAKDLTLAQANADWRGPVSTAGGSIVDEWAKNVFGRNATPQELARFGSNMTPEQAQQAYADFVAGGVAAGGTAKQLDMLAASQLSAPRTTQSVIPPSDYGNLQQQYAPNLQREINKSTETIEGRLNNVLAKDAAGNYTNDVVRQAVERATQDFARRGLVNTSMAAQAGQEAAIAKAIEIVGPDAARYFEQGRANQDAQNIFARDETQQGYTERNNVNAWQHDANMQTQRIVAEAQGRHETQDFNAAQSDKDRSFNLQTNYLTAQDNVNLRYTQTVQSINNSNMTPADKSVAIAQAAATRDGDLAFNNNLFSRFPGWQKEWLSQATSGSIDIANSTDKDSLATIANDPARPQSERDAARARLASLGGLTTTATPAPTPAPTAGSGWQPPAGS